MDRHQLLSPLSAEAIQALQIDDLVRRMDDIRHAVQIETYGTEWVSMHEEHFPMPRVADLLCTSKGKQLDEKKARRLADSAFRFLVQMDMLSVSSGISNQVIDGRNYSEAAWQSPKHQLKAAVLDQYQIVASRIALECFFDLIHIADCGERMSSGNGKFKAFRKWVTKPGNPYKYFVGDIIKAFDFDQYYRQKEVHGTSRFPQNLLRLEFPDSEERNISLRLTNILLNVWKPLIQILNETQPNSISIFEEDNGFAELYFSSLKKPENFEAFVKQILEDRFNR